MLFRYTYKTACTMPSIVRLLQTPDHIFFHDWEMWPAGSKEHKCTIGMAYAYEQSTHKVSAKSLIACLKQLSRGVFTIMYPALPSAMAILQISAHYAWIEGMWQIMYVHTFLGLLEESNIHTVLETLASSPGSPIFLKYSTECFKGAYLANQNPRSPL